MPISKHHKKGQTASQFRKNRNKRRAVSQAAAKRQRVGLMSAAQIVEDEVNKKINEQQ